MPLIRGNAPSDTNQISKVSRMPHLESGSLRHTGHDSLSHAGAYDSDVAIDHMDIQPLWISVHSYDSNDHSGNETKQYAAHKTLVGPSESWTKLTIVDQEHFTSHVVLYE